ncbi:hypothetical protein, partial [Salmonella enterica]|uniref:hypothetical protein n=1 Tax=Salmonella enterica TaxID=28901 RepID=UPI0019D3C761
AAFNYLVRYFYIADCRPGQHLYIHPAILHSVITCLTGNCIFRAISSGEGLSESGGCCVISSPGI